jgi:myo-inositol-1-phosphate synthase
LPSIRIAIAGVGNLCSALVQGIIYHRDSGEHKGLIHEWIGGYGVSDIDFVCAFDIDRRKVGKDLSKAIFSEPNNAPRLIDVPNIRAPVQMAPVLDGVGSFTKGIIKVAEKNPVDIVNSLKKGKADILVNLISGGANEASNFYAEAALDAGCAFLNATPTAIASNEVWSNRFKDAGLPIVGDDLLDQVGATVIHMGLLELLHRRGARIEESFQLDVGGGTESLNTLERTRELKRNIKTAAVASCIPYEFQLTSGSTDYIDFLNNSRNSFFWIKGRYFGGTPFTMDVRLDTIDAPNGGAVLIDVLRGIKLSLNQEVGGAIIPISAYAFKNPPERHSLSKAYELFKEYIEG